MPFETGGAARTTSSSRTSAATSQEDQQGVMARTVDRTGEEKPVAVTMSGGGEIGLQSMDASDKLKMSKALDAATGKSTSWVNSRTNVKFTVTPIKKVVIQDNPFCRHYQVIAEKGNSRKESSGTACVMTDGSWHTI
jgi:surface antigen